MKLHFQDETNTLYQGDVLEVLATLPDASIDLIVEDPPYNGVKDDAWDNQWKKVEDYLTWLDAIAQQYQRILKPNGSLYRFASPQMAAQVEVAIAQRLRVINRITWRKPPFATKAEMFRKEDLRGFFPASEAIVFCEQYGSDNYADSDAGYSSECGKLRQKVFGRVFGEYFETEFTRAGVTRSQVALLFPSRNGNKTGCVSNWMLGLNCPLPEQYQKIRDYLNSLPNGTGDYLRQEYEDLRQEYEDLRRPFRVSASVPYTDVWDYPTVGDYPGKHPCEKPPSMLRHIISASSRPDAVVLDCFSGSGNASLEARDLGRKAIAIERDPKYCDRIARRLGQRTLFQFGALMEATA